MNLRKKLNRGKCRYCGCTDRMACYPPCWWMNREHTVCSNPNCVSKAKIEGVRLRSAA
jgi:hypothetical protein